MNTPLVSPAAYLGLYSAQVLAVACNTFLDIRYGHFAVEVLLWSALLGWTLWVGWRQHDGGRDDGPRKQKYVLVIGLLVFVFVFIPMWRFPRAGVYMLFVLLASTNCVLTTSRQFHIALLMSAVAVMFAATHFRADWTMLFYLIPYLFAAVFALVSEQIGRRISELRAERGRFGFNKDHGVATLAATTVILASAAALYAVTPQLTWPYLAWRYGQLSNIGVEGSSTQSGDSGHRADRPGLDAERKGGQNGDRQGENGQDKPGRGKGQDHQSSSVANKPTLGSGWPSTADMRAAAKREGMPAWQSSSITQLANVVEWTGQVLKPLRLRLDELKKALQAWIERHRGGLMWSLVALLVVALLTAVAVFLRELALFAWLRTRYDYVWLGLFARHAPGERGARQYYQALERLCAMNDMPRASTANCREFLQQLIRSGSQIRLAAIEFTGLFEQHRYGPAQPNGETQLRRMRQLYRALFKSIC